MTDTEWICGWDQVFEGPWEHHAGPAQTAFFAQVALAGMPEPLTALIRNQQLEILDWGCALGDALPVLAQAFPASVLSGLDISPRAVARARERYPNWAFESRPLRELGRQVPVVYTSNCLEHFPDPLGLLRDEILPAVRDYLIVLVPYQESPLSEGHLVSFDADSFPPRLDGFGLLCWRVMPTGRWPQNHWSGQQLLVIYARTQAAGLPELILALQHWQATQGEK